jgi:CheY-like chemotaxis protein
MATILIVDDEKNIRTHLATFVGSPPPRRRPTRQSAGASGARPDVVVSDVRMAGWTAWRAREARQRDPTRWSCS